jgi:dihydroorotate dehydrogenase (fumarate)/dihydropyrimidine dehydrogenase (NAD+) subunit PreA
MKNEKAVKSVIIAVCLGMLLGIATDACMEYSQMPHEKASVNKDTCIDCGMCLKVCFSDAMQQGDDTAYVKEENCVGCGGCLSVCPVKGTIEMKQV